MLRKHEQELQILAQEAISTNFTGVGITKLQVAELALANGDASEIAQCTIVIAKGLSR